MAKQDGDPVEIVDDMVRKVELAREFAEEFPNVEMYEFNNALEKAR
jgi:hypothetical protein